jgi:hypothetical protein
MFVGQTFWNIQIWGVGQSFWEGGSICLFVLLLSFIPLPNLTVSSPTFETGSSLIYVSSAFYVLVLACMEMLDKHNNQVEACEVHGPIVGISNSTNIPNYWIHYQHMSPRQSSCVRKRTMQVYLL